MIIRQPNRASLADRAETTPYVISTAEFFYTVKWMRKMR